MEVSVPDSDTKFLLPSDFRTFSQDSYYRIWSKMIPLKDSPNDMRVLLVMSSFIECSS